MFAKHATFNIFYFLILLVNVSALGFDSEILKLIALPLISISLILYLIISTKLVSRFHKLIFAGLILSLAGDIQFLFSSGSAFHLLMALASSFCCYSLYSYAYFLDFKLDYSKPKRIGNIFFTLLFFTGLSFFIVANKNLGEFKYPVILYTLIILTMNVFAAYRHRRVNQLSFKLILTGSFAFVISDLAVGFYNFIDQKSIMMIIYLSTYLIAQYLVVIGAIERRSIIVSNESIC